jgi:hypothetical protein
MQSWLRSPLAAELPEWLRASALLAGDIAYVPPFWFEIR